jgi:heat shock protein HtpX
MGFYMALTKRIFLFIAVNFLVIITLSFILNLFHIQPFLKGYGLDIRSLMIFCLVWGMGGAFISLALSRQMAKWMMGVHVINHDTSDPDLRRLVSTVEQLSREAHLPGVPEVGIFESPEPNAFATGPTKRRSLVAVSTGLLRKMSQKELEGVLAHEIAHISNGDMVTMTLVQGVVNAFVMFLARVLAYILSGMGKSREQGSSGSYLSYMMFVFLFEVVFMVLGSIVVCWFSRFREFRADRGGADLAGKDKMIAALESLQRMQEVRDPQADKPSFQALKISTRRKSGFMLLFATHPPLEERISRLRQQ